MDYITRLAIIVLTWCMPATVLSLPPYGEEKHHSDKSAVAKEYKPQQVPLAMGTAECVRTAWIGNINHRTAICVEWRMIKKESK